MILNTRRYYVMSIFFFFLLAGFCVQSHAHNRAVVFHTLHIVQRDTRLCPYLVTCSIPDPSVVPSILLFPARPDVPSRLPPSHVSVSTNDPHISNDLALTHLPCPSAHALPFLRRPAGSARFQGCPTPSTAVQLHWLPASDGLQPMPGWPSLTVNLTVRVNPTKRENQRAKLERYFLECVY